MDLLLYLLCYCAMFAGFALLRNWRDQCKKWLCDNCWFRGINKTKQKLYSAQIGVDTFQCLYSRTYLHISSGIFVWNASAINEYNSDSIKNSKPSKCHLTISCTGIFNLIFYFVYFSKSTILSHQFLHWALQLWTRIEHFKLTN